MIYQVQPAVYIMANKPHGTLYTDAAPDLVQRAWQHRQGLLGGFAYRYECRLLVWFAYFATMEEAALFARRLKAGPRQRKVALIMDANPEWRDRFPEIL